MYLQQLVTQTVIACDSSSETQYYLEHLYCAEMVSKSADGPTCKNQAASSWQDADVNVKVG